jgi:hypothetical protein
MWIDDKSDGCVYDTIDCNKCGNCGRKFDIEDEDKLDFIVENETVNISFQSMNDMLQMHVHCGMKSKKIPLLLEKHQVTKILSKLDDLKERTFESFDYFTMIVAGCAETVMKGGMHR